MAAAVAAGPEAVLGTAPEYLARVEDSVRPADGLLLPPPRRVLPLALMICK